MTRKDTIIVAVLVNAALLIALFVTAIKREPSASKEEEKIAAQIQPIATPEPIQKKEIKAAQGDEIDLVLKEFSEKKVDLTQPEMPKIDFVKELEAITKAVDEPRQVEFASAEDVVKVTVKKGDVLEKIARANGSTVDEIIRANNLKNTMLQIGQVLKVPKKAGARTIETAVSTSAGPEYYVVKQGDNPWAIAVKNHLKVDELLKLNDLTEDKARRLKPGDKLRIK